MVWKCFYCDIKLTSRKVRSYADPGRDARTTDHIIPKSKWDASRYDCDPQLNFVQVCRRCNNVKADMWPLDWLAIMPQPGVRRFADRLLRMGCDPESISTALARRALRGDPMP